MSGYPWHAEGNIVWRLPSQGGRSSGPPDGPTYRPTAVPVLGGEKDVNPGWPASSTDHYSLEIRFDDNGSSKLAVNCQLRFIAPELVGQYLTVGANFLLMEGAQVVGELRVTHLNNLQE